MFICFRHTRGCTCTSNATSTMASVLAAPSLPGDLPMTCQGCYLAYTDFIGTYYNDCEALLKLLMDHGLLPDKKLCEKCGKECHIDMRRKAFRCEKVSAQGKKGKKKCNFFQSLYKGTWLEKSHVDFETNMRFVNLFMQDYFSYKVAKTELRLTDRTICDWASFCREVMVAWSVSQEGKIGGVGEIVEIDESKFGRRKYNVGRVIEGQWVFGGMSRNTRECFVVPVENRNRETLLAIIKDRIVPGTTVISDCWKAYDCLGSEGFQHLTVSHSLNFVDPETAAHTNTIERQWRELKRRVPMFGRRNHHFVGYLATAMFKMRFPDVTKRFHVFITQAAKLYPPPSP